MQRASFADLPDRIVENIVLAAGPGSQRALARTSRGLRRACAAVRWPSVRLARRNLGWIRAEIDGGRFGRIGLLRVHNAIPPEDAVRIAGAADATSIHLEFVVEAHGGVVSRSLERFARAGLGPRVRSIAAIGFEGCTFVSLEEAPRISRAAPNVERLAFGGYPFDGDLRGIARAFRSARFLAIYGFPWGRRTSLAPLARMPALEGIWAADGEGVGLFADAGEILRGAAGASLRTLCAKPLALSNADVHAFARARSLRELQIAVAAESGRIPDLGPLAELRTLEVCTLDLPPLSRPGIASEIARGLAGVARVRLEMDRALAAEILGPAAAALGSRLASVCVRDLADPREVGRYLDDLLAAGAFCGKVLFGPNSIRYDGPWAESHAVLPALGGSVGRLRARRGGVYLIEPPEEVVDAAEDAGIDPFPDADGSRDAASALYWLERDAFRQCNNWNETNWIVDAAPWASRAPGADEDGDEG